MADNCGRCGMPGGASVTHICPPMVALTADKKPHRCPICGGTGNVPADFYGQYGMSTTTNGEKCRACSGRGIVIA